MKGGTKIDQKGSENSFFYNSQSIKLAIFIFV